MKDRYVETWAESTASDTFIPAIQPLSTKIDDLEERVDILRNIICDSVESLEKRVEELENTFR